MVFNRLINRVVDSHAPLRFLDYPYGTAMYDLDSPFGLPSCDC